MKKNENETQTPEAPETSEAPEAPETSEAPETPETAEAPEDPDTDTEPSDEPQDAANAHSTEPDPGAEGTHYIATPEDGVIDPNLRITADGTIYSSENPEPEAE